MKKILLCSIALPFLILCPLLIFSQATQSWVQRFAASSTDWPVKVLADGSGNVYVTGTKTLVPYGSNIMTIKYNAAGVLVWAVEYNSPDNSDDVANAMSFDPSGNLIVAGYSINPGNFRMTTIKYSASGLQQWVSNHNPAGSAGSDALAVTTDASGNVYVAGYSTPSLYEDNYEVVKYNSAGTLQWSRTYDGTGSGMDWAKFIRVDASGNVYITGESFGKNSKGGNTNFDIVTIKYNAAGTQLWLQRFGSTSNLIETPEGMVLDGSGNVYVTGYRQTSASKNDAITLKYNTSGVVQWTQQYNGPANASDGGSSIVIDPSGNIIVGGYSQSSTAVYSSDFLLIKYSPAGGIYWTSRYDGGQEDAIDEIALDGSGNIFVTGNSFTSAINRGDFATAKYTTNGALSWIMKYNGPGNGYDYSKSIAVYTSWSPVITNQPVVYVTGESQGNGTGTDYTTIKYTQSSGTICCVIGKATLSAETPTEITSRPSRFSLSNYPNPFKGSTSIVYDLPSDSRVSLKVFDVQGREVAAIYEGNEKAGSYRKNFDAAQLAKGIYQCRLTARSSTGELTQTSQLSVQ